MFTKVFPNPVLFFAILMACVCVGCSGAMVESPTPILTTDTQPPTSIPSYTPTPTPAESPMQLTFVSNRKAGYHGVYAVDVFCLEDETPCFGEPRLLFEMKDLENSVYRPIDIIDWSPDGQRVTFISRGHVNIADWNGKNRFQIPGGPGLEGFPRWSPDGTRIAYLFSGNIPDSEMIEPWRIQIFNLETGQITPVLEEVDNPGRVIWLMDDIVGYTIEIPVGAWATQEVIRISNLDGTVIQQLILDIEEFHTTTGIDISPDRSKLCLSLVRRPEGGDSIWDLYTLDLKGENSTNLTSGRGNNLTPRWSPYGDWIAFMSDRSGNNEIYLIKPDGSHLIQVTGHPSNDFSPAWRWTR